MSKEINEEKDFLEKVDRLLAGEEIEAGKGISEDYRSAINFAQKLIESRADPSPHFKDQLKQRLLSKLVEQEAEAARKKERGVSFWEFLGNLVPRSPVWRTATATLVVVLVTVSVLWRTGMFSQAPVSTVGREEAIVEVQEEAVVGVQEEAVVGVQEEAGIRGPGSAPALGIGGGAPEVTAEAVPVEAPQGVMEKIIELNQTQIAGGLSITLEQVELHSEGIAFSAFTTPPGYSPPQDSLSYPLEEMNPALAEYTANGTTIYARYSTLTYQDDGIELTWGYSEPYLDPVPSDAAELVFTIISFGEWQGPWEFIVPLKD